MSTITLTFGEGSENGPHMQINGNGLAKHGFQYEDLMEAQEKFHKMDVKTELIVLHEKAHIKVNPAYVLVIRDGVQAITQSDPNLIHDEQMKLTWDSKALMYGRVVNKRARHNLCYGVVPQSPDYKNGKGTIVPWNHIPFTQKLWCNLPLFFGDKASKLQGEGNYYYDVNKCGIGFHGDSERKIVIAARFGTVMPLYYLWYHKNKIISPMITIKLNHGDMYVMCEKASGNDWKNRNKYTLRHAAGCDKYVLSYMKRGKKRKRDTNFKVKGTINKNKIKRMKYLFT